MTDPIRRWSALTDLLALDVQDFADPAAIDLPSKRRRRAEPVGETDGKCQAGGVERCRLGGVSRRSVSGFATQTCMPAAAASITPWRCECGVASTLHRCRWRPRNACRISHALQCRIARHRSDEADLVALALDRFDQAPAPIAEADDLPR